MSPPWLSPEEKAEERALAQVENLKDDLALVEAERDEFKARYNVAVASLQKASEDQARIEAERDALKAKAQPGELDDMQGEPPPLPSDDPFLAKKEYRYLWKVFKVVSKVEFAQRNEIQELRKERDALRGQLQALKAQSAPAHTGKRCCAGCGSMVESLEDHAMAGCPGPRRTP